MVGQAVRRALAGAGVRAGRAEVRPWARARALLRAFGAEAHGQAALVFALTCIPLVGMAGIALDAGRAYLVEAKLSRALDAAGLAAARVEARADARTDARSYFDANFPDGYLSSRLTNYRFRARDGGERYVITATAEVPTTLTRVLGRSHIAVERRTEVQRLTLGLEIALVMDNTGSMNGDKIREMKRAARRLVNILFGDAEELDDVWVSLVPYTAAVNIGPVQDDLGEWLRDPGLVDPDTGIFGATDWKGCVMARTDIMPADAIAGDESDEPPSSDAPLTRFVPYFYPRATDNRYDIDRRGTIREGRGRGNEGTGPNLGCGPAITPLTNRRQVALDAVAEMHAWSRGGTASNLGAIWGWRSISPRWRGLWPDLEEAWPGPDGPRDMPLDYDEEMMNKVVVLLTDGDNQFYDWSGYYDLPEDDDPAPDGEGSGQGPAGSDHTAYGRLNEWQPGYSFRQGQRELDAKVRRVCAAMRAEGVVIYAITFGTRPNADTRAVYEACAGDPDRYFHAPSGSDLQRTFRDIGQALSDLRIVE
ncbi:MAG: pilus assembly protein TadG-related protein [Paracoccaceae bacterium]